MEQTYDKRPIGVFDSGLGGLTAVKELLHLMPEEDIVYFGDTARVPYGTRDKDTIIRYSKQDVRFLVEQDVKMIVCACGTVSSTLPKEYSAALNVPFTGVVEHAARQAARVSRSGIIGVIGTQATISSGSYVACLRAIDPDLRVTANACPLFVPLVENGYFGEDNAVVRLVALEYLQPLKAAGVDTLIFGCTHYPLLKDVIADIMGDSVALVDSGKETARYVKRYLTEHSMLSGKDQGKCRFCVSSAEGFSQNAGRFLERNISEQVEQVAIDSY